MRPCISIRGPVRRSVGRSVGQSVGDAFIKNKENQYFQSFHHPEDASLALWALLFSAKLNGFFCCLLVINQITEHDSNVHLKMGPRELIF